MRNATKKFFHFFFAMLFCTALFCTSAQLSPNSKIKIAKAQQQEESQIYAKAKDNCILFASQNTSDQSLQNILFIVPAGYFVRIVEVVDETTLKVIYIDRIGFVLRDSVKQVSIVPQEPYEAPQQIQTKAGSGTQLRQSATTASESIALIPPSSFVTYIANTKGQKPTDGLSEIWYFVQYFPPSEPTIYYEGYIYSERVASEISHTKNTEDDHAVSLPLQIQEPEQQSQNTLQQPTWLKGILIAVMCLPCLLFAIYLSSTIIQKRKAKTEAI